MSAHHVTVQLRPQIADALRQGSTTVAQAREVSDLVSARGSSMRPILHDASSADALGTTFVVEAPDEEAAQALRQELAALDAVEAAYIKPPEELP
jgi:hypothetical protein